MKLNKKGIDLMHQFEGLKLKAYLCPANVATIGYGNTYYEDGKKVMLGDEITEERADQLFLIIAEDFSKAIRPFIKSALNENQFSALVCFAYNVGVANLKKSTLLTKVNANKDDKTIRDEFMKWDKANGKTLSGLTRRRKAEADLYYETQN